MSNRLDYFDCLRGIVMVMVIFCHTCGKFSLNQELFWLSHLFNVVMLPGFFFVSGWFTKLNFSGGGWLLNDCS